MTQPPQSMPSSHSAIIERYEELRREMLSSNGGSGGGPGLALFLRQGMKGWIDAWRHSRIAEPPRPPVVCGPVEAVVPWDLRAEMVAILAGMALSIGQEMRT